MESHRTEGLYLPIKSLGDLAKPNPDTPAVPLAPPAICSRCGGPLEPSWEFRASGLWWAYAKCPACSVFFVRRSPARTAEEWGWREEPDPPQFVRDPNWASDLKREVAGGAPDAEPLATPDRGDK